jgi:hypothetical protein
LQAPPIHGKVTLIFIQKGIGLDTNHQPNVKKTIHSPGIPMGSQGFNTARGLSQVAA